MSCFGEFLDRILRVEHEDRPVQPKLWTPFVEILKCIFCCGYGERQYCTQNWRYRDNYGVDNDYSPSRTITYRPLTNQCNSAQITSSSNNSNKSYQKSSSLSSNSYSVPTRDVSSLSSDSNRKAVEKNSVPTRDAFVKSSTCSAVDSGINRKIPAVASQSALLSSAKSPSATTRQSSEVPSKLKHLTLSSSSSASVLQTTKVNQVVNKATEKNFPNSIASGTFQPSQPSSKEDSYSYYLKPSSVTAKASLASFSEKSSESVKKPKNSSSSTVSITESNSANRETHKLTDQKLPCNVNSASYGTLQSSHKLPSSQKLPPFSGPSNLFPSAADNEKPPSSIKKDPSSSSPLIANSRSPRPPPLSTKPTLSPASSSSSSHLKKTNYVWVEKCAISSYVFPEDIKSLIEKDIVPGVLKLPLSRESYKNYFHALLYAEDCHLEKWDCFEMKNVTLELHDAAIYTRKGKFKKFNVADEKEEKVFVAFEIDKIPERRPFLLSRDFVLVKPSSQKFKPSQGVIYRVVRSNLVLADFGETFHSQYDPECLYDVKFSFNRVCLKRAHHAVTSASDTLYRNFIFPDLVPKHEDPAMDLFLGYRYRKDALAIRQILRLQGGPPYLVEGPKPVVDKRHLSRTGVVIVEAVLQICRTSPSNKILICAPLNNTCDVLMRGLMKEMPESDMFRANAAFREVDGVPEDIFPSCLYESEKELFACPALDELQTYKVILSTFMSSFRLRDEGIKAGYFSHIFLVDASSATEPETMVPLANFAIAETVVVITGTPGSHSGWVRSKIARQNGLMTSYFERLSRRELYKNLDPRVMIQLEDSNQNSDEIFSSLSRFKDLISLI